MGGTLLNDANQARPEGVQGEIGMILRSDAS